MDEPAITVNGVPLSVGQSMTVRVALVAFYQEMIIEGLGDDEHGKKMATAYKARASEVLAIMRRKSANLNTQIGNEATQNGNGG